MSNGSKLGESWNKDTPEREGGYDPRGEALCGGVGTTNPERVLRVQRGELGLVKITVVGEDRKRRPMADSYATCDR